MPEAPPVAPLVVLFAAVFTDNILLTNFLGMCSFLAVSRQVKAAAGLGAAVIFVMTATSIINWVVYHYVLVPLKLEYLQFIVFIVVIAAFVQLVEMVIERISLTLYYTLGIFLPLITVNCAILGAVLFNVVRNYTLPQSMAFGAGGGIGWALAILAMAGIREKLQKARLPRGLEGPGISLIIAGLMALAFVGFTQVLQIK